MVEQVEALPDDRHVPLGRVHVDGLVQGAVQQLVLHHLQNLLQTQRPAEREHRVNKEGMNFI